MSYLVPILSLVVVVATGLAFLRLPHWWIRGFDFPRPQIAALGMIVLVAYLLVWKPQGRAEWALFLLLAVCTVYQCLRILPYTPVYPKQVLEAQEFDPGHSLSILVFNVFMENRKAQNLLRLIRERSPDVVLVVEPDAWWAEQLEEIEEDYPFSLKHPLDNTYGMLLYSRLELRAPEVEFLLDEEIPSMHADVVLRNGRTVRFHGLHPRPPSPTEAPDSIGRDGELLLVARRVSSYPGPSIVAGDLNDVAWSSTTSLMQRMSGLLDPRIGRGLFSTFHAKIPVLRWPLDHVFHSAQFQLVSIERLPAIGSDHFPVFAHLALAWEARREQKAPELDTGDLSRVIEKIEDAEEQAEEPDG